MKTTDGYTTKTADGYSISMKSQDEHNYPLTSNISTQKNHTVIFSPQKTFTVVIDQ